MIKTRINQIRVSSTLSFFKNALMKKYNLTEYSDLDKPAIFNGMYRREDYDAAINHRGHKTIIWCGTDATYIRFYGRYFMKLKKARHIVKSEFLKKDLIKYGVESTIIPVTSTSVIKNQQPRGDNIYFYGSTRKIYAYGYNYVEELMAKTKYNIILATKDTYSKEDLQEVYKSCFIGLRLTAHDGLPNTVCEMNLMGRRCIYNGNLPNSIPFTDTDSIIRAVDNEFLIRNEDNSFIVNDIYKYLNLNDSWLYV